MMTQANNKEYIVDPHADAVIILENYGSPFALEAKVPSSSSASPEPDEETEPIVMRSKTCPSETQEAKPDEPLENAIVYRVSSRHLTLSSGYYRRALSKDWIEGHLNGEDGLYHLSAEHWDPDAFLILMNIIHSRHRQVPREVSFELLAKLAVLVDYYECREAVEIYSDMWIQVVKEDDHYLPKVYCRKLMLWLCISWVFRLSDVFHDATQIVISTCTTPVMDTLQLPIPHIIVGVLNERRCQDIESIMCICDKWGDSFRSNYVCPKNTIDSSGQIVETGSKTSFACGAILLGALMKEMERLEFREPSFLSPFFGWSVEKVLGRLKKMKTPRWCDRDQFTTSHSKHDDIEVLVYPRHSCSLKKTIIPEIEKHISGMRGLELNDFIDYLDI